MRSAVLGNARAMVGWPSGGYCRAELLRTRTQEIPQAIQEAMGIVPVWGAYTLGQVIRTSTNTQPEVLNQGIGMDPAGSK